MLVLYIVLGIIAVLAATVLIRTLTFTPKKASLPDVPSEEFDKNRSVEALRQLIRCKTVSYYDSALEDDGEFEKLVELLPELYPSVCSSCELKRFEGRALLFRWKGERSDAPSVMMAHYDVVPADEDKWDKPAFDALIEGGVLWGRGSLDTKVTVNAVMYAVDTLISRGFTPAQDVWLAFSGGEEVNGKGAKNIVEYFKQNGISPALVVDEGGAVVEDVFPGVKKPCGLVGIAEKGLMNMTFTVESNGGHASAPEPHTPIGILAEACRRVEKHPFPFHITKPTAEMFDTLGRYSTFGYRMIFANLWLFSGVLNMICKKKGGETNALLRTTVAFTQASGSAAPNVIPPKASLVANMRLNPKDSVASATERIRRIVANDAVKLTVDGTEPSKISRTDCPEWEKVSAAVAATWKGCIVAPYLMVQSSDSLSYGEICDRVYRFCAMDLTAEERATIHGHNERIRLETVGKAVEFYLRLLKQC